MNKKQPVYDRLQAKDMQERDKRKWFIRNSVNVKLKDDPESAWLVDETGQKFGYSSDEEMNHAIAQWRLK